MKEIMIYGALNSEHEIVWGIYHRNPDLNWSKFYSRNGRKPVRRNRPTGADDGRAERKTKT